MIRSSEDQKKGEEEMNALEAAQKNIIWRNQDRCSIRTLGEVLNITGKRVRELYDDALESGNYPPME